MADGGGRIEEYRRRSRRSWSLQEKLAILGDLARSGDPLAAVARRHGMNANHLLTWRRQSQQGTLGRPRGRRPAGGRELGFVRVEVAAEPERPVESARTDAIEIELAGGAKVRFDAGVDPGHLCGLLRAVRAAL